MTRSVYVTGIDRGDGRQVVELGVMELLTRQVDRVGVFRPLVHDSPDRLFDLLRARYRLTQDAGRPCTAWTTTRRPRLQAEQGTDELVSTLVDRFHRGRARLRRRPRPRHRLRRHPAPGRAGAQRPARQRVRRLGASPSWAAASRAPSPCAPRPATPTAPTTALGCDVVAMVANRVAAADRDGDRRRASPPVCPCPCYVLPGRARALRADRRADHPHPGRRGAARRRLGARARRAGLRVRRRHAAELPGRPDPGLPGRHPRRPRGPGRRRAGRAQRRAPRRSPVSCSPWTSGPATEILTLAARLAPGTPVVAVPSGSFPTAAELFALEGKLNAATPRKAETALGLFERHVDTGELPEPGLGRPAATGSRR